MNFSRRRLLQSTGGTAVSVNLLTAAGQTAPKTSADREYWVYLAERISEPVLTALAARKLKAKMPIEAPHGNAEERAQYTHLEACGRLLAGIAPWLESGSGAPAELALLTRYREKARLAIAAAVDPASPDFMNFTHGQQPLVDSAYLTLAVLRAPGQLWEQLDKKVRMQLGEALRSTRIIKPGFNNWLLFSATIEAFLCFAGEQWDSMRVDYAIRQHEEWYKGDGAYGDGPPFHWDYYNSFVVQPMLLQVFESVARSSNAWAHLQPTFIERAKRHAAIEERLISPEGSFPSMGRSTAYRFGAFHLLANMALRKELPPGVSPEQVRCGLTAVLRRVAEAPSTFDKQGWLTVGFYGHQPAIAESYISTGSLYLCAAVFLPLGLPATDSFWQNPPQPWTAKKIWGGIDMQPDHAIA